MKLSDFKFDRGWKILIYFDLVVPALIYLFAFLSRLPSISLLFHSYEMYIVSPVPNFQSLTGILGLLYHAGIIGYTIVKKNYKDMIICIVITLIIALFFAFDINYMILKPLDFANL